jgi:hypothetical protein
MTKNNTLITGLSTNAQIVYMEKLMNEKKLDLVEARKALELMCIVEKQSGIPLIYNFNTLYNRIKIISKQN